MILSHYDFLSYISWHTFSQKMFPNFLCDLPIGHLVYGFNGKDVCFESFMLNTFFQLAFCLARTKNQDRLRRTDVGNDLIIKFIELCSKFIIQLIVSLLILGAVSRLCSRGSPIANMSPYPRFDFLDIFAFIGNKHNNSLPMINPYTCLLIHEIAPRII